MDVREISIALNAHPRIQRAAACRLAADPTLWAAEPKAAPRIAAELGIPLAHLERALEAVADAPRTVDAERRRAEELGCRILTRFDDDYPSRLLDHPLPPPALYLRGRLDPRPAIAIVGSRRMDEYGREVTELFARDLARAGVCVVSGFALGVDQAAHRATLDAGGETVAVLGCGIDIAYPARSRELARRIAASGAVLTEFPLGREPRAWHFPIRNRVIASLASGTLVVQAKERSGSLITAHQALDLGRDVYAVPGRIFDLLSTGTNGLLADGAHLVSSPLDILEHLAIGRQTCLFPLPEPERVGPRAGADAGAGADGGSSSPVPARPRPEGFVGEVLGKVLGNSRGRTVDDLATELGQTVDRVLGALLELELGGHVERGPGPVYRA